VRKYEDEEEEEEKKKGKRRDGRIRRPYYDIYR